MDEVQFVPELLSYIKIIVDQSDAKGQYFLTGSQNLSVLKSVAESMAGRVAIIEVWPMIPGNGLSRHWLEQYLTEPQALFDKAAGCLPDMLLIDALWRGGFPALLNVKERGFARYFTGYLSTYIDRDIRTMAQIEDIMKFENFVSVLAALTAEEINYEKIGREIAAQGSTARRWLNFLGATYMWRDARPFEGNAIKRVAGRTKGYFIDTGLACQLLHIASPHQLLGHPRLGYLFETYINNMVVAVLQSLPFGVGKYHWRAHSQAEVDIVLESGNTLYPIEVKIKASLSKHDSRGIKAFQESYKDGPRKVTFGLIVYAGNTCYWVSEGVLAVPWNLMLKE